MKLTIDTKDDSHEHIRQAISLLQNLLGENSTRIAAPDYTPPAQPQQLGDFMNMFEENSSQKAEDPITEEKPDLGIEFF